MLLHGLYFSLRKLTCPSISSNLPGNLAREVNEAKHGIVSDPQHKGTRYAMAWIGAHLDRLTAILSGCLCPSVSHSVLSLLCQRRKHHLPLFL